jgi:hypothetical protein
VMYPDNIPNSNAVPDCPQKQFVSVRLRGRARL